MVGAGNLGDSMNSTGVLTYDCYCFITSNSVYKSITLRDFIIYALGP